MAIRHGQHNRFNHPISWNFGEIEGYQFAGTADTIYQNYEDTDRPGRYLPRLYYTLVKPLTSGSYPIGHDGKRLAPGSELCIHAVPMISNFDEGTCKQDKITYKWDYVEDLIDIHNLFGNPPSKLKCWLINQPDGLDVKYWYGITANPFLITTWSQGMSTYLLNTEKIGSAEPKNSFYVYDSGYDLAPALLSVNSDPIRHKAFRCGNGGTGSYTGTPDSGWFRHACLRNIEYTDNKGDKKTRTFMIYFDIDHKFYAFPTSSRLKDKPKEGAEGSSKYGYVPMSDVVVATVPWPSVIDETKIGRNLPEQYRPDWSFSHDGKHAVCIARIIDEPWTDQGIRSCVKKDNALIDVYDISPIMVEIGFELNITGDNPEDFSFTIALKRVIDPIETGRSIVSAQYSVKNFKDKDVKADDLIILEYEMRMTDIVVPTKAISYDVNNGGDILSITTPVGDYLINPNKAVIAKVKNIGKLNKDGDTLFKWCAYYSSEFYDQHDYNETTSYDPEIIFYHAYKSSYNSIINDSNININDWFNKLDHTIILLQRIYYHSLIQSIELSTLSFVTSSIMIVNGDNFGWREVKHESMSGVNQLFIAFGNEVSSIYKGNALLKDQIMDLHYLKTFTPHVESYKLFDLRAKINSDFNEPLIGNYVFTNTNYTSSIFIDNTYLVRDGVLPQYNNYNNPTLFGSFWYQSDLSVSFDREELFAKANVQDITINYGYETSVKNRVFNCADVRSVGISNNNYIANLNTYYPNYVNTRSFEVYPKLFTFFDASQFHRPGAVHQLQSEDRQTSTTEGEPRFFNYPIGKIFFNRVYNLTMSGTNSTKDQIRTHPNGSYAVFTLPIIAFKEKHSMGFYGDNDNISMEFTDGAGTIETEQLILDKIHIVYEYTNKATKTIEYFTKDTTHLDMMNLAFKKDLKLDDYEFKLQPNGNSYLGSPYNPNIYLGGLSLQKKWENPSLSQLFSLIPNGVHNASFPFDTSKVIGCNVYSEYNLLAPTNQMSLEILSNVWFYNFTAFSSITTNPLYQKSYLELYCPTPRMESLFYFSNAYIDRDENNA